MIEIKSILRSQPVTGVYDEVTVSAMQKVAEQFGLTVTTLRGAGEEYSYGRLQGLKVPEKSAFIKIAKGENQNPADLSMFFKAVESVKQQPQ